MKVPFLVTLLLYMTWCTGDVSAASFMSLESKTPKCVEVDSYAGATLALVYSSPDLIALPHDDSGRHPRDRHLESDIMDKIREKKRHHEEKVREMHDLLPTYKSYDTLNSLEGGTSNISILIEEVDYEHESDEHRKIHQNVQITQEKGTYKYKLKFFDSAKICVQSLTASTHKPTFFSLLVKEMDEEDVLESEQYDQAFKQQMNEYSKKNREAFVHLEWIEKEMTRLIREVNKLTGHSHASKERNVQFHEASVKMKKALTFWKKIQILILIVFGAYNASNLIKHLKLKGVI
jgi:hypothetical protein